MKTALIVLTILLKVIKHICFLMLIYVCLLLGNNVKEEEDTSENCENGELDRLVLY